MSRMESTKAFVHFHRKSASHRLQAYSQIIYRYLGKGTYFFLLKLQKVTQKLLVLREDSSRVNEEKKIFTRISHNRIDIDKDMFFFSFFIFPLPPIRPWCEFEAVAWIEMSLMVSLITMKSVQLSMRMERAVSQCELHVSFYTPKPKKWNKKQHITIKALENDAYNAHPATNKKKWHFSYFVCLFVAGKIYLLVKPLTAYMVSTFEGKNHLKLI